MIDSKNTLRGTCLFRIEMKSPHAYKKSREACEKTICNRKYLLLLIMPDDAANMKIASATSLFNNYELAVNHKDDFEILLTQNELIEVTSGNWESSCHYTLQMVARNGLKKLSSNAFP